MFVIAPCTMPTMGFWEFLSELVKALAWPGLIAGTVYFFRDELRGLLKRLVSAKFPGGEVNFGDGHISSSEAEKIKSRTPTRERMELQILNTLFTKQVNKWPNLDVLWTFIITGSDEFREAKGKLLGEGLIGETPDHQIFITRQGFKYCKSHYDEIKDAPQWWENEQIDPEKLRKVLSGEIGPKD
jgi:hypothetical protein